MGLIVRTNVTGLGLEVVSGCSGACGVVSGATAEVILDYSREHRTRPKSHKSSSGRSFE
jgi:hypothetical protein